MLTISELIGPKKGAAAKLARDLEVSEASVSRWRSGRTEIDTANAAKIAKAFRVKAVLDGEGRFKFERRGGKRN